MPTMHTMSNLAWLQRALTRRPFPWRERELAVADNVATILHLEGKLAEARPASWLPK